MSPVENPQGRGCAILIEEIMPDLKRAGFYATMQALTDLLRVVEAVAVSDWRKDCPMCHEAAEHKPGCPWVLARKLTGGAT